MMRFLGVVGAIVLALFALRLVFTLLGHLLSFLFHGVWGLLGLVGTIAWIIALVDIVLQKDLSTGAKIGWFLLVLFTHVFGAVIYFLFGRRRTGVYA